MEEVSHMSVNVPSDKRPKPPPAVRHPDETRIVEDHEQTAHKLAIWAKYPGAWATIIARTRSRTFRSDEMWIVETHAGAGLHLSREHPDGVRPGTPVLACYAARDVQRRNPGVKVRVRAIDIKAEYVQKLQARVQPFLAAPDGPDHVDVEVYRDDFANRVRPILAETAPGQRRSLWFSDPYGIAEIPHRSLEPLAEPRYGPEVIINLDVSGLWRVSAAGEMALTAEAIGSQLSHAHKTSLDRTYGSDIWWSALRGYRPRRDAFDLFATVYADTFPTFEQRHIYRLRSSENQVRYFIHLGHSPMAATAFANAFKSTENIGLFAGRSLSLPARAQAALAYSEFFAGEITTVEQLYESGRLLLDRGQVKVVCRAAEQEGYGTFDEPNRKMKWFPERLPPQLSLLNG
jgi:three-Cys-motif partner protein